MHFAEFGDPRYVDFSVMPPVPSQSDLLEEKALIEGYSKLHPDAEIPPHLKPEPLASAIARGLTHDEHKREFYRDSPQNAGAVTPGANETDHDKS
jgi:hypothetical protein